MPEIKLSLDNFTTLNRMEFILGTGEVVFDRYNDNTAVSLLTDV